MDGTGVRDIYLPGMPRSPARAGTFHQPTEIVTGHVGSPPAPVIHYQGDVRKPAKAPCGDWAIRPRYHGESRGTRCDWWHRVERVTGWRPAVTWDAVSITPHACTGQCGRLANVNIADGPSRLQFNPTAFFPSFLVCLGNLQTLNNLLWYSYI